MTLLSEDVYPNAGEDFILNEPDDQKLDRKKEKAETLAALPVLEKLHARLEEKVKATDSIKESLSVADEYKTTPENAQIALNIVNQLLEQERSYISDLIETHSPKK